MSEPTNYALEAALWVKGISPDQDKGTPLPQLFVKSPACEHACQQAVNYGVWPEHSCYGKCVYLTPTAPPAAP